jgi:ABC-2 type transport system ATP-binding protein
MIEIENISKKFDNVDALTDVSAQIRESEVFGLIGTNGAGKSTLLRIMSGILRPDAGKIRIDQQDVYENISAKADLFYISDDQFYYPNDKPKDMMSFYKGCYPSYDKERFEELLNVFELPKDRKISTYSKGMKKQLFVALGLAAGTKYLFCDETFDGLDPLMRQKVKALFRNEMEKRQLTPVIASHSLRELEDICNHIGLLHKGGILFSREMNDMQLGIHRINLILRPGHYLEEMKELEVVSDNLNGSIHMLTLRGDIEKIKSILNAADPVFYEEVPLTLEEVFICETESFIKKLNNPTEGEEVNANDVKELIS